jgi:uncharacterized FlaG/YvyC family protein
VLAAQTGFAKTSDGATQNRELIQAVQKINECGHFGDKKKLVVIMDRATRKPVIRIVDIETEEVVSQIPSETVLQIAEALSLLD